MSKIFLGIDGGGTKTDFSLVDEKGNLLAYTQKDTIHAKQVSKDNIIKRVNEALDELFKESNKSLDDIEYTFAGVPGYGEFPEIIDLYNEVFSDLLKSDKFQLGNDSVAGWAGSQAAKPGVNMVLGTGAIAYGIDYKNNEARSSGWGPLCGDEGSGYWLGLETIKLFAKQSDSRLEKSHLYDLIKEDFNLENDFDFIQKIIDLDNDRTKIAKFSKYLSKASELGDKHATKLIERAGEEAALAINAVIEKLDFQEGEKIYYSYSGGVFNIGQTLTDAIERKLIDKNLEKVDSILTPVKGSCLMAMKYAGIKITDEIIQNMKG